ncbi:MAG TPA: DUF523 domain-containing protein [Xanthomonadales bacterium]|nr:DUF523 domain-containing protein [Xanthomonadales bacterium]
MHYVLVSACLLGQAVRHDGGDKRCDDDILQRWLREGRVVPICPEVAGGLPVPRPPAEIAGGAGGRNVLAGLARVVDSNGRDVSAHFVEGAEHAAKLARARGIRVAVLKEGSPSCGSSFSYDGSFARVRVPFPGVTAARLLQDGIAIYSEAQLAQADARLRQLEAADLRDQEPDARGVVIIHTAHGMYLSRSCKLSWRDFQELWPDFQTSLGPWSVEAVIDYLDEEHPDLWPPAEQQVRALECAETTQHRLSFRS